MAIYYLCAQVIGRSAGRSAVAAAAYRTGERLVDQRTGQTHDYTRRREDIETEILAPERVPEWVKDREQLWNQVEAAEKRGDAQLARELVVALPTDLNRDQQRELIRGYVQDQFVSRGMITDLALHFKEGNPHAHVMLTMRGIGPDGFGKKVREWNRSELLEEWRAEWARHANQALERAGKDSRIDHRSLVEQGLDRMAQVHMGPEAAQLERQGVATANGDHNRLVAEYNATIIDLERAREKRDALREEHERAERHAARLAAGWPAATAEAMANLEGEHAGALTHEQVKDLEQQADQKYQKVVREIERIRIGGGELVHAGELLQRKEQLVREMARLTTPLAMVKRWFSAQARSECVRVNERLAGVTDALGHYGVKDAADLADQVSRWQVNEEYKLPHLERQRDSLRKTLAAAHRALWGFTQEQQQEQWLQERHRSEHSRPQRFAAPQDERQRDLERAALESIVRRRERSRGDDRGR